MKPLRLLHSSAGVLPLLCFALAIPHFASSQPLASGSPELAPEARERLSQAAGDALLPQWQRDFMLGLARGGTASALDSVAAGAHAGLLERASGAADGSWAELVVPALRAGHSAIYDPVRDRMVVFGGEDGLFPNYTYYNDVWALSLAGTPAWTALTPTGTPPSARVGHSAIYDPVRDRMVVFGGAGASGLLNDVWALSLAGTPAWTALTPTGTAPSARGAHSAIFAGGRMVVFGGYDGSFRNDAWAMALTDPPAWTALTPTGTLPSAREFHSAIYDSGRNRMVVFGGSDGVGYLNDVWALVLVGSTRAWTALTPTGTPPSARAYHSAIYDPVRHNMVVFGGYDGSFRNDAWALSLASSTPAWTALTTTGTSPSGRELHSAIYDPVRDRMVVFGGGGTGIYNDAWALSLAGTPAWTALTGTPPNARSSHSTIYDPVRDRMVVFGGYNGSGNLNDVWALTLTDPPAWTALTPTGTPPIARYAHSAIYDPVRDRMLVFGGYDGSYYDDVWALWLAGPPAWTALTPTGTAPSARGAHSAIYDPVRDRMVVFGGAGASGLLNDVWALSLAGTPAWTALTPTDTPPSGRSLHSAIYDPVRERMVVFGGTTRPAGFFNDVWALALAGTPAWTALTLSGTPPSARDLHSAIYDPARDCMLVFGGEDGSIYYNDVWALSLAGTPAWTALTPTGTPPSARYGHRAIYDPVRDRMVVFGGGYPYHNDVWALSLPGVLGVGDPEMRPLISYLRPPAPNPFSGATTLSYSIAKAGRVQVGVYDVSGRLVRRLVDRERRPGAETVVWNGAGESGSKLGAGVYFVRLAGPSIRTTRKVILLW